MIIILGGIFYPLWGGLGNWVRFFPIVKYRNIDSIRCGLREITVPLFWNKFDSNVHEPVQCDNVSLFACLIGLQYKKARLVLIGLDDAGKTSLLCMLKESRITQTFPTIQPSLFWCVIIGVCSCRVLVHILWLFRPLRQVSSFVSYKYSHYSHLGSHEKCPSFSLITVKWKMITS